MTANLVESFAIQDMSCEWNVSCFISGSQLVEPNLNKKCLVGFVTSQQSAQAVLKMLGDLGKIEPNLHWPDRTRVIICAAKPCEAGLDILAQQIRSAGGIISREIITAARDEFFAQQSASQDIIRRLAEAHAQNEAQIARRHSEIAVAWQEITRLKEEGTKIHDQELICRGLVRLGEEWRKNKSVTLTMTTLG
jgi:hypothetical protein